MSEPVMGVKSRKGCGLQGETLFFQHLCWGRLGRHHQETSSRVLLRDRDGTQTEMLDVAK